MGIVSPYELLGVTGLDSQFGRMSYGSRYGNSNSYGQIPAGIQNGMPGYLSQIGGSLYSQIMSNDGLKRDVDAYRSGRCDFQCKERLKKEAEQRFGPSWRDVANRYRHLVH